MSYHHFWSHQTLIPAEDWTAICESSAQLVDAFRESIISYTTPSFDYIFINAGHLGHEPFCFERQVTPFASCDTSHMPYDKLICGILAVAAARYAVVNVTSRGSQNTWTPHLQWAGEVLGREIPMPRGILPDDWRVEA